MSQGNASFVDFKEIKQRVGIIQILDRYSVTETLSKSGGGDRLSGACPLHGGNNRTHFRVSVSRNCWNCFGDCRGGGNILDFVAKKEGVSIREAALLVQEWFPISSEGRAAARPAKQRETAKSLREEKASTAQEETGENKPLAFELNHLDPEHPYLAERGLSKETIVTFGLGYCSKGLLKGRIAIPIHNRNGQMVAYAGRLAGTPAEVDAPKYKLPPGFRKAQEIFNLHRALSEPQEAPLVIVEGFFGCMTLWQHGVRRVVALMGSTLSPEQEESIMRRTTRDSRVVVMLDENEAGRKGRDDIARRLSHRMFVKVFRFGKEGQQPDNLSVDQLREAGLI